MQDNQSLTTLVTEILNHMEQLQYSAASIKTFRREYDKFSAYVSETTRKDSFSEQIGAQYLKDKYDFPSETAPVKRSAYHAISCIRRLGEYHLCGSFRRTTSNTNGNLDWALGDKTLVADYLQAVQTSDNSERTKQIRSHLIKRFYKFLELRGIKSIREIFAQHISDFVISLQGLSSAYVGQHLSTLRYYFKYLYEHGLCQQDWSGCLPKMIVHKNLTIPTLWEKSEIELLLKGIDRGSPTGKRDYAIILLAVQLGLRVSDIVNLKLSSLKWERKELDLIQQKTGERVVHSLLGDVGWAIIDYIKNARPNVEEPFVFITLNAPYTKITTGAIGFAFRMNMRRCGIVKRQGTTCGMHSLRHTLARRLLEDGTSLEDVSNIMGHKHYSSITTYSKVDIDGLRECGLSLSEVPELA
jgi:site-specific recombinase XerD